ncbi:1-phosphofructokinase family hexose kinase [Glaciibacter superstes]|uniref:1-phosphofructokinase family hexose kinase n=1 Tax=Glaciibacter superstes TaxID=501023 RepID=UPI0003B39FB4|nr:PfkB family carbohydrate kinase [Glaciibacter superstes]
MIHFLGFSPAIDVTYRVDQVTIGGIHRPSTVLRLPGGKSLNAARAAARLGASVHAIVPTAGRTGDLLTALIGEVRPRLTVTTVDAPGETRNCVTVIGEPAQGLTEFYEPAPELGTDAWAALLEQVRVIPAGDWLAVSGSVPQDAPLGELVVALSACSARGVLVAVDVHGPALSAIVAAAAPTVLKVNRAEAAAHLGIPSADTLLVDLASRMVAQTGGTVVLTDGVDGSLAAHGDRRIRVHPDPVVGAYSVGSGDCYLAGLVTALANGDELDAALTRAAACASANTAVPGAAVFDVGDFQSATDRIDVTAESA